MLRSLWRSGAVCWLATAALIAGCGDNPTPDESDVGPDVDVAVDSGPPPCQSDNDCDDGLFCNGAERCNPNLARADERGCIAGTEPCIGGQSCQEAQRLCVSDCEVAEDADGDGHKAVACGGMDCDDADPGVNPAATEVCDAEDKDEDCNPATFGLRDVDRDGSIDAECCNEAADGTRNCGEDCDDGRRNVHPASTEACDRVDNDCDGRSDEGVEVAVYPDADRDGHGRAPEPGETPVMKCPDSPGFSPLGDDCNDQNPAQHPAQAEICDALDNDCDEKVDEKPADTTWYEDRDGDGFGSPSATRVSCDPIPGYVLLGTDCNDDDPQIHPAASEQCNGIDDDCSGQPDFEISAGDGEDDDGDGVADARCGAGGTDCDDEDPTTSGGASELCDGSDNDCDGSVDEETVAVVWYRDADGDGWGSVASGTVASCQPIAGYSTRGGDCDDGDASRHPGATEICNGIDDDCEGGVDEGAPERVWFRDQDGDGVGSSESGLLLSCAASEAGFALVGGDCADDDATRAPGVEERCNDLDDDCDGASDEGFATLAYFPDVDKDGFGSIEGGIIVTCADNVPGYSRSPDDCDDGNPNISPAAIETCDGLDNDCNGDADDPDLSLCPDANNGLYFCDLGQCQLGACQSGFEDCNGDPADGCEVTLGGDANCGSCGDMCPADHSCHLRGTDRAGFPVHECAMQCLDASECGGNQLCCAGRCVFGDSDAAHCGSCDSACPADNACVNGSCGTACGGAVAGGSGAPVGSGGGCEGTSLCCVAPSGWAQGCADIGTDPNNCGDCARKCPGGTVCSGGDCVPPCVDNSDCSAGDLCCGGGCVRTDFNPMHCGGCDRPCALGESCFEATCMPGYCGDFSCDPGLGEDCRSCSEDCGPCGGIEGCGDGTCDPMDPKGAEDCASCPADCGSCTSPCGDGFCDPFDSIMAEDCSSCPTDCMPCTGSDPCGDAFCDAFNPGMPEDCGNCEVDCGPCPGGLCSVADQCAVEYGHDCCGSGCVDTRFDDGHCGFCFNLCSTTEFCDYGTCNTCIDGDGDSFIDGRCPAGNDCDDFDPQVFPGATEYCNERDEDCDTIIDEECQPREVGCNFDAICQLLANEDASNCSDCFCSDGICDPSEDPFSCPADCA